jgi:hypothetical protein
MTLAAPPVCPARRQRVRYARFGVFLSPLKAAILDSIKHAGAFGVSGEEIHARLYRRRRAVLPATAVRSHIAQINGALAGTRWRVRSAQRRWFLVRSRGSR